MPEPKTLRPLVLSANVAQLRESATIAVSARARALRAAGRQVLDLGAGEPDFDTPRFIREAAAQAVERGATRYTATEGIAPLREIIAARASEEARGGPAVDPRDVVVSNGSKQALFNACFTLFGPGDEVLIPTPGWTSYYEIVALARAIPVAVAGDPENALKIDAGRLADAATPSTRGVILNSPCNPTGAVYDRDELEAIFALADEQGWWLITDEIYRRICYGGAAPSMVEIAPERDRVVVIDGVAKAYAMTGWRIGWSIAPRPLSAAMAALQSHVTSNAAAVSQHAALAALSRREEAEPAIAAMVAEFRVRRDAALAELRRAPGLRCIPPDGAFYLYLDVAPAFPGSDDPGGAFARILLDEHDVAVVPGAAFLTPDWVRLSYAAPREQVIAGVRRAISAFEARVR